MKASRFILIVLLLLLSAGVVAAATTTGTKRRARPARTNPEDASQKIDINNISMVVKNTGSFAYDAPNNAAGLEFPKGTGKTAVFAAGLWMGALVSDTVRVSVAEYTDDYRPGQAVGVAALGRIGGALGLAQLVDQPQVHDFAQDVGFERLLRVGPEVVGGPGDIADRLVGAALVGQHHRRGRALGEGHHPVGGGTRSVLSVDRATDVVDDDLRTQPRERERVLAPQPSACAGHERHAPVQANRHVPPLC